MRTAEILPDMLTVQQVANYLNVSRNTVYSWTNSGVLPSFKAGNTRRIRKETLLDWICEKERNERGVSVGNGVTGGDSFEQVPNLRSGQQGPGPMPGVRAGNQRAGGVG